MEEIIEGVFHWRAVHPNTGSEAGCHFVTGSGTAIDPLLPAEGIEWFDGRGVERIVLSTRHHLRHAPEIAERFSCPILCHESGLHEFADGPEVEGFAFGEQLAADVTALEMDAISPDDTVLRIEANGSALLFADSVVNRGALGFVSDSLIGDDPEAVKERIRERCAALLDERFEHLLFAHGDPWIGGGRPALQAFAAGVSTL
jgi:glyoxylase-like metal-dependent hydrolase (beta-lactamase superfamily II)